jgi:hypothetical protein
VLRENLVLSGVEAEVVARQRFESQLVLASICCNHLSGKKIKEAAEDLQIQLDRMHEIGLMGMHIRTRHRPKGSIDALVNLYQALEKTSIFQVLREKHYRINPQERPRA